MSFFRSLATRRHLAVILAACAIVASLKLLGGRRDPPGSASANAPRGGAATAPGVALTEAHLPSSAAAMPPRRSWVIDSSAGPVSFTGRAFLDGHPASGLTITMTDELTSEGLFPPRAVVSDREGRFAVGGVRRIRGSYRLAALAPGAAPAWATLPGDATKDDIELRLETCKAHVYGVVTDASGGAVAAAKVFLEKVPEHLAMSDGRGNFELCMSSRTGRLHVEAESYGAWLRWVSARGALRQDVTLIPAASLAGSVVLARGGAAVPFALVSVRLGGDVIRDGQADEEGHFDVVNLSPGSYTVAARGPGVRTQHPIDVAVFASAKANVTVPVDARARVRGRLVSSAGPVTRTGVNVGFSSTMEWATAVRTDEDGSFSIDDAPIGNVFVQVDDHDVEAPKALRVPEGGLADVTVRVTPKARVLVTVTRQGAPVSDATVFLRGPSTPDSQSTNAAGIATFRALSEGSYRAFTEHENDFAVAEHVDVGAKVPANVTLELTAGRQVAGRVVDERGRPVDGARIAFSVASDVVEGGASAISGADGTFRGGPLRGPASYTLKITRSGFVLEPKGELPRLDVPESGPATPSELVLVVKSQDKDLTGRVVDSADGPVRDVRVTVSKPERFADVVATTFSANDGSFAFHGLGGGPWSVKALAASGSQAEVKPVTLPSGDVRIELPAVGTIRGTLKGFTRAPTVMAWSIVGYEWDFHPALLDSGRFTITGLSRGRYHVAASTTDAAAQTTVDVDGAADVAVELVASGTRTRHGRTLDFVSGKPLPNLTCQAALYIGARSPVVVPGSIFSNEDGVFELVDVPAANLYMWCNANGSIRGGIVRIPSDLGDKEVIVWGLDLRAAKPLDTKVLGLTMADDFPFSRQVAVVEPKGPADRAGVRVGDVVESASGKSFADVGNGMVRNYVALLLSTKTVPLALTRAGAPASVLFKLE